MFAKLYETDRGQILVKFDTDNDECAPEVRFYFEPEGLGVCSTSVIFSDDDSGWDKCEKFFNRVDEVEALDVINKMLEAISNDQRVKERNK